jgi:hypothetical protein
VPQSEGSGRTAVVRALLVVVAAVVAVLVLLAL